LERGRIGGGEKRTESVSRALSEQNLNGVDATFHDPLSWLANLPKKKTILFTFYISIKNAIFWDVMPCGSRKNRRFGGT
jgi:hypothetical protein